MTQDTHEAPTFVPVQACPACGETTYATRHSQLAIPKQGEPQVVNCFACGAQATVTVE